MEREVFTVADVYEHAAAIGKDIESIVNQYGKEAIEEIMPKIVYVLEQLEALAEKNHENKGYVQDLMMERDKLIIHSKRDEAIQRELEEKLGYMETLVSNDKKELEQQLKMLQQENDCLCDEVDKRDNELVKARTNGGALPGDIEVMMRMKTTIDGQRDQIRHLNHETQMQRKELEALQEHSIRLSDINEQLRTNMLLSQSKLKNLEANNNNSTTSIPTQINNDDAQSEKSTSSTITDPDTSSHSLLDELNEDEEFNHTNNSSFTDLSTSVSLTSDEQNIPPPHPALQEVESGQQQQAITEQPGTHKDPDRPRYTLKEMQSLLEERNLYKIKMMALEEELDLYKGGNPRNMLKTMSVPNVDTQRTNKPAGVRTFMQKFLRK